MKRQRPVPPVEISDRLKELNTKSYYLLVALSFAYKTAPAWSLKWALALTATAAVLPLQDYFKSSRALNGIRWFKVACLTMAFLFTLWWVCLVS
jgi:urea transporter